MKKKILAGILAASLSLSLTVNASASTIPGDANNDGKVSALDALAILKHVAGTAKLTGQGLANADANNDGKVGAADALKILKDVASGGTSTPSADEIDWSKIPYADEKDFVCGNEGGGVAISTYNGEEKVVNIPPTINGKKVVQLGDLYDMYALGFPDSVTDVNIPNSVTRISWYVFSGCTSLKSVTIPNSVTEIGPHAFARCTSLKNITIPDSVTSIVAGNFEPMGGIYMAAFDGCTNIKATYKGKTYDYAHINDLYKAINGN